MLSGLQQGNDRCTAENAYEIIVSAKLYEQQKYLISTNAVPDYTTLIVSDEFYQGLTKEQQKIIDQAAKTAQEKARESADDRRVQRQKVLEDEGMQIVDEPENHGNKCRKCQPVYDAIRKQAGDKLVDLYMGK
ncbi:MAG: TRAP transporter substrate-binding protein DctP [Anaerobutyricum sp.]